MYIYATYDFSDLLEECSHSHYLSEQIGPIQCDGVGKMFPEVWVRSTPMGSWYVTNNSVARIYNKYWHS
jgi:hypothetical protein